MLPLALMISVDVCELAVHQSTSRATPPAKGRNVLSLKKSTCDRNQAVNNEPHSEQLFRRTNNIAPINQEALSS